MNGVCIGCPSYIASLQVALYTKSLCFSYKPPSGLAESTYILIKPDPEAHTKSDRAIRSPTATLRSSGTKSIHSHRSSHQRATSGTPSLRTKSFGRTRVELLQVGVRLCMRARPLVFAAGDVRRSVRVEASTWTKRRPVPEHLGSKGCTVREQAVREYICVHRVQTTYGWQTSKKRPKREAVSSMNLMGY